MSAVTDTKQERINLRLKHSAKPVRFNKKLTAALKEHEQRVTNR